MRRMVKNIHIHCSPKCNIQLSLNYIAVDLAFRVPLLERDNARSLANLRRCEAHRLCRGPDGLWSPTLDMQGHRRQTRTLTTLNIQCHEEWS